MSTSKFKLKIPVLISLVIHNPITAVESGLLAFTLPMSFICLVWQHKEKNEHLDNGMKSNYECFLHFWMETSCIKLLSEGILSSSFDFDTDGLPWWLLPTPELGQQSEIDRIRGFDRYSTFQRQPGSEVRFHLLSVDQSYVI